MSSINFLQYYIFSFFSECPHSCFKIYIRQETYKTHIRQEIGEFWGQALARQCLWLWNYGKVNGMRCCSMFGAKKSSTPVSSNVSNPSWYGTAVTFVSKSRTCAAQWGGSQLDDDCWGRAGLWMVLVIEIVICTVEVPRASCSAMLGMAHMWSKSHARLPKACKGWWGVLGKWRTVQGPITGWWLSWQ